MVSAPPESVTVDHEPLNDPQVPLESVAVSRSTMPLEELRPEPASLPLPSVSGTDRLVYQGPPERAALWPVGPVASLVTVKVEVAVPLAPLYEVTVCAPEAAASCSSRCRSSSTGSTCRRRRRSCC